MTSTTPSASVTRQDDNEQELNLLKLWQIVWLRKWTLLAMMIVAMALATVAVYMMTPIYRAGATLLIEDEPNKVLSIEQVYGLEGSGTDYLQTQIELLKSRALAERVVRQLDLTHYPEFDPRQQPEPWVDVPRMRAAVAQWLPFLAADEPPVEPEDLTEEKIFDLVTRKLMSRTGVAPMGKSQLVKVEVDMADAKMARDTANAIADGHIQIQVESSMNLAMMATQWMNNRLGELREKLLDSENRLQAYREAENLVDVKGVTTISADELAMTSDRMINARRARAEAESQFQQVEAMKKGGWTRMASIPAVLGHPLSQQFSAQEAQARARVEELSKRYGPKHPAMIAARTELAAASASVRAQVEQVVAGIERNYQLALANERSLQTSFDGNKSEIQDISRKAFKVRELEREVDSNRTLYDTFMTRLKETTATSDLQNSNARVVDHATLPRIPVKPQKALIIGVAGLLALALGAGIALLLNALNNTVHSVEQVESKLGLPVFGIVPKLAKLKRNEVVRLYAANKDKLFSESLRTLRTRVILFGIDKPRKVVLVASTLPGEGKTVVAANTATAFGQLERVLLIEADMRRPTLAKNLGLPDGTPGLVALIRGDATASQCVRAINGVDVITAGGIPPNPLELLSSPAFGALMTTFESQYDRIIIDSPPVHTVSDAVVLGTYADTLVYVVNAGVTTMAQVERSISQLRQNNVPVSGMVLNQVDIRKAQRYGYRYGGYYDYYGYSGSHEAKV